MGSQVNHPSIEYHIRRAAQKDAEQVYDMLCLLEEKVLDLEKFSLSYSENLESERNIYLVIEGHDGIMGFLTCHGQTLLHHAGSVYEIQELYIRETHRSLGLGKAMLDHLYGELEKRGYEMLEVASNTRRERAHAFYLREGFKRSHYKFTMERACKA